MFSLNDVDVLLEIKDFLDQGLNIAGIKKMFELKHQPQNVMAEPKDLSDDELRRIFREELMPGNFYNRQSHSHRQGDLSRFYQ